MKQQVDAVGVFRSGKQWIQWILMGVFFALSVQTGLCADGAADITFSEVVRKYMYLFLGGGCALIVMVLATLYMANLNTALRSEIGTRKQTEKALQNSVDRFKYIVACSGDWIWETDPEGRYTYTSDIVKNMLGYCSDDVVGKYQHDFFTTGEKEGFEPVAKEFYASQKKIFRKRLRLVTDEGRVVIHQSTSEPMLDSSGTFLGYRGVNRDVTKEVRFVQL